MFLRQQQQVLVSLAPTTMPAAPAFALLPTTDMVEVVRLHVPWSVFRTHARQYGDSPQWKLNRERLWRHKIDHQLGELSEQELYEHYITHVRPRATRSDVGKPRHLPSAPTTSVSFAAVAGAAPLAEATIPALVHSTSRSALNPHVSSSSCNPSANSEVTMDREALLSDSPSSTDTAFSSASPTTGRSAPSCHNEDTVLALMTEVASLRRTADLLGAALLEQRSHQADWEMRVSSQLARLESAIADATPAGALASTRTATAPVNNDMRQNGVAGFDPCVRFGLKRRRVSVVMKASGATQGAASASLFDPALIDQVPREVLELLKWDDVYFEPLATPAGPNNVLWAYTLTEPMGSSACESQRSVREHLRSESCLINFRWNEELLKEYNALVQGEDGEIDAAQFLEWKARVSHSAICIFHSSQPHQMLNPLYLNIFSRALYQREDGCYIALVPCSTQPATPREELLAKVCQHMTRLFQVGDTWSEADTQPDSAHES